MNNTIKTLPAIAAVLIAATLVVGGTLAATPSTAFAYQKKPGQDSYKKGAQDNGNSKNGNTVTIEKCKQKASVSGFDNTLEQECQNLICTHPGNNATCVSEAVTPVTPVTPPSEVGCPPGTLYNVQLQADLPDDKTIPAGTILCLPKKLGDQIATISTQTPVTGVTTVEVVVANPNLSPCPDPKAGFVLAQVESGDPGKPIGPSGTVCVKNNEH